jgi:myosin heavy subunit
MCVFIIGVRAQWHGGPTTENQFAIRHSAGQVVYDVKGFVDKNIDQLSDYVKALFAASKSPLLAALFRVIRPRDTPTHPFAYSRARWQDSAGITGKQQALTVSQNFSMSLDKLLSNLKHSGYVCVHPKRCDTDSRQHTGEVSKKSSHVRFIRCIKTNHECKPDMFDRKPLL